MTGQIPDNVIYNDAAYDLVGIKGEELYEPFDFGLTPVSPHTANWRGFVSCYEVSENILTLKSMKITIKENRTSYPLIDGVTPKVHEEGLIHLEYNNMRLKTTFSGTILIAKDFIDSMYVHMGFQSPLSYKEVIELEFKDGILTSKKDFSKTVKKLREQGKSDGKIKPGKDVMKWIERTFSLDYEI